MVFWGMVGVVFCWDTAVVLVLSRDQIRGRLGRGVYLVEKVAGVMLASFGLLLPFA